MIRCRIASTAAVYWLLLLLSTSDQLSHHTTTTCCNNILPTVTAFTVAPRICPSYNRQPLSSPKSDYNYRSIAMNLSTTQPRRKLQQQKQQQQQQQQQQQPRCRLLNLHHSTINQPIVDDSSSDSNDSSRTSEKAVKRTGTSNPDVTTSTTHSQMYRLRLSQRIRKWIRRTAVSLFFASSIGLARPSTSVASNTAEKATTGISTVISASTKTTAAAAPVKSTSLRPGMSKTQADALEQGDTSVVQQIEQSPSMFQSSADTTVSSTTTATTTDRKAAFSDYGDSMDEEDDDDADLMQLINEDQFGSPKVATQNEKALGDKLRASSQSQFASYQQGKSFGLSLKVAIAFFAPTYGFMIGREYVRRRREERYVKKGLEILEAQKAEYFNITNTKNDVDVEDELKNLKNKNSTKSDDDDEDDDDEDDDDDDDVPPPTSRRPPRKPLGGPPNTNGNGDSPAGGGSSTGNSGKSGNSKPSAADIDKLNKLLGKS